MICHHICITIKRKHRMATKRQLEKLTINSSPIIERKICDDIETAMQRMWDFSYSENGNNRSSGKTDYLHKSWEAILKNSFGDFNDIFDSNFQLLVEKEKVGTNKTSQIKEIIDIFGAKFKVDMLLSRGNEPHTVFLLKAPLSSINKNRFNSVLNLFGEIQRFYGNPDNKKIELVFVNFTPKETFTKNDKQKNYKKEIVQYLGLNQDDSGVNKPKDKLILPNEIKNNVHEIHIEYVVNFGVDFSEIKNESSLKELIKSTPKFVTINPPAIKELKDYILHFMKSHANLFDMSFENNDDDSIDISGQMKLKF
jgi:hypothetical protein